MNRVLNEEKPAFREIVERHGSDVFRIAFRMVGNEHDAEEVVQETFLRAYKTFHKFQGRSSLGTWLYRIAVNCSIDLMRGRRRRETESLDGIEESKALPAQTPDLNPHRELKSSELRQTIETALERLTQSERTAFVLRHFEGRSIAEIASILTVRNNAAKHTVFRAVRKLRTMLEPLVRGAS